jgi:hypothetical protein
VYDFNLSLLGKWHSRLLDHEGLWFKVLVAKIGLEDGRVRGGRRRTSTWWRDMFDVRD